MQLRNFLATLALAGAVACSDDKGPTAPTNQAPAPEMKQGAVPLVIPVNQVIGAVTVQSVQITEFGRSGNNLTVSGILTYTSATTGTVTQAFEDVVVTLNSSRRCQILFLDIGPIFLDLLGLQVDLSQITLDITAVAGAGNLLGNLLCALAGLLDQFPLNLTAIDQLLAQINAILAGLTG